MSLSPAFELSASRMRPMRGPAVDPALIARCAEVCADTSIIAEACADACCKEERYASFDACIRTALMCSVVAEIAGESTARFFEADMRMLRAQLEACVRTCASVATECDKHKAEQIWCGICAEHCRACAHICESLLEALDSAGVGGEQLSHAGRAATQ